MKIAYRDICPVICIAALLLIIIAAGALPAGRTFQAKSIGPGISEIAGVTDALFDDGGELLIVQDSAGFGIMPVKNLTADPTNMRPARRMHGRIIGFLPGGSLGYGANGKTTQYRLSPPMKRQISNEDMSKCLRGGTVACGRLVWVRDDMAISGEGKCDSDTAGTILIYKTNGMVGRKPADIHSFEYALVSSSRRWVAFEDGCPEFVNLGLFNVARSRTESITDVCDFTGREFAPADFNHYPLCWIEGRDQCLVKLTSREDASDRRLLLLDMESQKPVWNTGLAGDIIYYDQINDTLLLAGSDQSLYEVDLRTGKLHSSKLFEGGSFAVSPDRQAVAFLQGNQLQMVPVEGGGSWLVAELPSVDLQQECRDWGIRRPVWSPQGELILVFATDRLYLIHLN